MRTKINNPKILLLKGSLDVQKLEQNVDTNLKNSFINDYYEIIKKKIDTISPDIILSLTIPINSSAFS